MNYELRINEVDLAAFLIALGYEMENYTVTNIIDFNNDKKRTKSGSWIFSDYSENKEFPHANEILKRYKLPEKNQPIQYISEYGKLAAHNYQVLKSVITENKPLMQIFGDGYTILKNDNGAFIPEANSYFYELESTKNLMDVAILCALGCRIANYSFNEKKELFISILPANSGISLKKLESEKASKSYEDESNFNILPILLAYEENRKELLKGVYNDEKIMIIRGSKRAIFSKDTPDSIKERIIKELN